MVEESPKKPSGSSTPPDQQQVTVETETVPSVATVGVISSSVNPMGTLRIKRSQDSVPRQSSRAAGPLNSSLNGLPAPAASRKRSQRFSQATKADIFAAKVANAVDEHDSSGSDETFVYDMPQMKPPPFQRSASSNLMEDEDDASSDMAVTSPKRESMPKSPRTFVVPNHRGRRTVSSSLIPTYEHENEIGNGPMLVTPPFGDPVYNNNNYDDKVMRHIRKNSRLSPVRDPKNDSIRAKRTYLQRWKTPGHNTHDAGVVSSESDERTPLMNSRAPPSLLNYQSSKISKQHRNISQSLNTYGTVDGSTLQSEARQNLDDEDEPIYAYTPMSMRLVLMVSLVLILLLFVAFVIGAFITLKRPLQELDIVSLSDVFISDKELVFSLIARARNPGLLAITINHCALDIFATSAYTNKHKHEQSPRTVLLGSITNLESPIQFHGGFSSAIQWRTSSVKLLEPLGNDTALWSAISAHDFDLTVKGVISYDIFWSENKETVSRAYHVEGPEYSHHFMNYI